MILNQYYRQRQHYLKVTWLFMTEALTALTYTCSPHFPSCLTLHLMSRATSSCSWCHHRVSASAQPSYLQLKSFLSLHRFIVLSLQNSKLSVFPSIVLSFYRFIILKFYGFLVRNIEFILSFYRFIVVKKTEFFYRFIVSSL